MIDNVKFFSDTAAMAPYHHGDLPNALKAATAEVVAEKGVAGFSLREVARRAGVSHAAPAHHFGDAQGLLTAVAVDGFAHLREVIMDARAGADDPAEALVAVGRAYVELGERYPGHCELMFRHDVLTHGDPRHEQCSVAAYEALEGAIIDFRDAYNPDLDVDAAALHCWATMQGVLVLYPSISGLTEHRGRPAPPMGELAERLARLSLEGLLGNGLH